MEETISFSAMYSELDSLTAKGEPKPFSLMFATADVKRQTGGDIHIISKRTSAMDLLRHNNKRFIYTESQVIKVVGKTNDDIPILPVHKLGEPKKTCNPHHDDNSTINILILSSKATRKIHPRLILYFNDKKVLWY